ncbi:hypothetical protein BT93_F1940 [Corymbia citriodora subsp. variegata]|nr:hypothetical protein BT93_F1940 [Corymbia citriodora subsp. variegata]
MDVASPLLEAVKGLWGLASKPLGYIYNLKDNVRSLNKANENSKALSEDVKANVEREEGGGGAQRTNPVENWLGEVQEFEDGAYQALQEAGERDRIKCLSLCLPRNRWSSYKLGQRVYQLLNEARELQHIKEEISDFVSPLPPPQQVLEMPLDKTLGLDSSLNVVWKWLVDKKEAGVIGLYGVGGVGKTTLTRRIDGKLSHANHGFEVVIWVVVSKQRVRLVGEVLSRKKFVLLMDDVWVGLELHKIGVLPSSLKNGSKVVFTTWLKQVCHHMSVEETLEAKCLMPEEALALFENSIGKSSVHFHPKIQQLASDIVKECKGLPLTLITIGRAMASRENPDEWKHALKTLRYNPYELSSVDYLMRTNDLIELWIGEGFLRGTNDVYSMRYKGEYVLRTLEIACLLKIWRDYEGWYVKMHDIIRDMATWITCDHGQKENKSLVIRGGRSPVRSGSKMELGTGPEGPIPKFWDCELDRIILEPGTRPTDRFGPEPPKTNQSNLDWAVLGLSGSCCTPLLAIENHEDMPTEMVSKWREAKKFTCLRWLLLDDISKDILIPTGAIANLPLNVFSKWNRFPEGTGQVDEKEMVEKLGCMQHLTDLSINVRKSSFAQKIFQSLNLQRPIRRVTISNMQNNLTSIVINYSPPSIWVSNCGILDLSWLVHAPKLQRLHDVGCNSMEKIIGDGIVREELAASGLFSRLESLEIINLPKLRGICDHTLLFPQGVNFFMLECPGLRMLLLGSNGTRGSFLISGYGPWWAEFKWDPATRVTFQEPYSGRSPVEEITWGEAPRKIKDESVDWARIRFLPLLVE